MLSRENGQFFGRTACHREAAGLMLSENLYAPCQTTPRHTHATPLLYFVLQGHCAETVQQQTKIHAPSHLVFLPAGEPHATRWDGTSQNACFHLEFTGVLWQSRFEATPELRPLGPSLFTEGQSLTLIRRLYAEFRAWDNLSSLVAEGIALELVAVLGRQTVSGGASRPSWLRRVEARLRDQFAAPFSLEELAQIASVHPAHLVRAFRQHYHCTPGDFARRLRIEEACRLLHSTPEMPLADIALRVGFADQSHFNRTFRRLMGDSPGAYRRKERTPCK